MEGKGLWYGACIILIGLAVLGIPVSADDFGQGRFATEVVHDGIDLGKYSSLAFSPSNGYPYISYYDAHGGSLKYAYKHGSVWSRGDVENADDVGQYSSLAFDSTGKAGIAYYDTTDNDLKFAYRSGWSWVREIVDSADVGQYCSLAFDGDDKPCISYRDAANKDLKFARKDGDSWDIDRVDSGGDVGTHTSLVIDYFNHPFIAYHDVTNGNLKWAYNEGVSWQKYTLVTTGDAGHYSSFRINASYNPWIVYYNNEYGNLDYIYRDDGMWHTGTIDLAMDTGAYCSLAFDGDDNPCVSYYDVTHGNLRFAYWSESAGDFTRVTVDSGGDVGKYSSLAFDADGHPCISYYDATNGNQKYAYWVHAPVVNTITPDLGVQGGVYADTVIHGLHFTGTPEVRLLGLGPIIDATAETRISEYEIRCTIPVPYDADSGEYNVVVINPDGQAGQLPGGFTVLPLVIIPAPVVTSITPASKHRGNTAIITDLAGNFFQGGAKVSLIKGGHRIKARGVSVESSSKITCRFRIPDDAPTGLWDVKVKNPDAKSGTLPDAFRVRP